MSPPKSEKDESDKAAARKIRNIDEILATHSRIMESAANGMPPNPDPAAGPTTSLPSAPVGQDPTSPHQGALSPSQEGQGPTLPHQGALSPSQEGQGSTLPHQAALSPSQEGQGSILPHQGALSSRQEGQGPTLLRQVELSPIQEAPSEPVTAIHSPQAAPSPRAAISPGTPLPPRSTHSTHDEVTPMSSLDTLFEITDQQRRILDHDDAFQAFLRRTSLAREPNAYGGNMHMSKMREQVEAAMNEALDRESRSGLNTARPSPVLSTTGLAHDPEATETRPATAAAWNPEAAVFRPARPSQKEDEQDGSTG